MLVGVPQPELCEPLACVLQNLGVRRAMVVCGWVESGGRGSDPQAYLDELSTVGRNTVAEFYQERGFAVSVLETTQFMFQEASLPDLIGGDAQTNAEIVRRLLSGKERGPKRDALLLNAGAALMVAGRASSILAGSEQAAAVIDEGLAWEKLKELMGRS